ncbi:hypothetical protein J3E07_001619 [Methanococcus voltae]|uniref:Uncharacterized protein n=1 Tax=Methanococcus voltae TaxID=2188 RepID=A0A8J7UTZ2_METVO|nr:hypothetical protein [Methanococcus voltae]MBP2202178.1 hypothetical protein [Methanococcus voltae]
MDEEYKLKNALNNINKRTQYKGCLWDDENCSEKIIKAHSIQNNRILSKLADKGEVIYFENSPSEYGFYKLKRTGRKIATVFSGFCGYHDREIFKPIELKDYSFGDKEQEYIFAYRALAKELHAKLSAKNASEKMIEEMDNPKLFKDLFISPQTPNYEEKIKYLKELYNLYMHGIDMALYEMTIFHERMKKDIVDKNFESLITKSIVIPGISISVSSMPYIEYDLKNNILNDVENFEKPLKPLFINLFPHDSNTIVLLSYFKEDSPLYEDFVNSIIQKPQILQKPILSNIILIYVENFVISPTLWDSYSKRKKEKLEAILNKTLINKELNLLVPRVNLFE